MVVLHTICLHIAAALCFANAPANTVSAVRVTRAPLIDGKGDDAVWISAPAVDAFRQWAPRDDAPPSMRTEFRVAYDEHNLYVLVRAFDPHPDSIVRTVARRDAVVSSDEIGVYIDSYGDHRNGYEFHVNAAGVKRDVALSGDFREDASWDGVWDAAARVDSTGWTAEFRIPFSQLRFAPAARHRFGFLVNRTIERYAESVSWPVYHANRVGIVSQFGELDGLEGIDGSRAIEAVPYVRSQSRGTSGTAIGGDLRVGLASNVNINATVNPDFGQVEADPSVVNLSSVETFFPEQRPFFLEGAANYQVSINCNDVNCADEGLFYSRRIGRAPQLSSLYGANSSDAATPIVAAAKLTSRSDAGVTVAALSAVTARVTSADGQTIEPATVYGVTRAQRDFRDGQSGVSAIMTVAERSLDSWTDPYLPRSAVVGGGTFRHRFGDGQYELWGSATESGLQGSAAAVATVQRDPVHYLQRPDAAHAFDSTRTALRGDEEELAVGKYGGLLQFESSFERQSAGYDPNDLGYLERADEQSWNNWVGIVSNTHRAFYRSARWNVNLWNAWTAAGTRLETAVNTNTHVNFNNNWWFNAGVTEDQLGGTVCDHCARGGPAIRTDPQLLPWMTIQGDTRQWMTPSVSGNWRIADGGRSRSAVISPELDLRVSSRVHASLGLTIGANHDDTQWFANNTFPGGAQSTFAHLDQSTRSITIRGSYAATPNLSLELYAAPFASDGIYNDLRALSADPLAASYDARFVPYAAPPGTATSFAVRQLRANAVLRWEYRPGSTLFVVWSHTRDGNEPGTGSSWSGDARELFAVRPMNTLLIKVSYWLAR